MFNDATVSVLTVFSWLVLIVGAVTALYIAVKGVSEGIKRLSAPASRQHAVFAASEPTERAPDAREADDRR